MPGYQGESRRPVIQRQSAPSGNSTQVARAAVPHAGRVLEQVLEQVLGTAVSVGNTQASWEEASAAVAAPCQELEQQLHREPVLNGDETGWRTNGEKRYLWAFVAASFVLYTIARTRGSELLIPLLGAVFEGILCSDRFSGYLKLFEISSGPGAVLLGPPETEHPGRAGFHQADRRDSAGMRWRSMRVCSACGTSFAVA